MSSTKATGSKPIMGSAPPASGHKSVAHVAGAFGAHSNTDVVMCVQRVAIQASSRLWRLGQGVPSEAQGAQSRSSHGGRGRRRIGILGKKTRLTQSPDRLSDGKHERRVRCGDEAEGGFYSNRFKPQEDDWKLKL